MGGGEGRRNEGHYAASKPLGAGGEVLFRNDQALLAGAYQSLNFNVKIKPLEEGLDAAPYPASRCSFSNLDSAKLFVSVLRIRHTTGKILKIEEQNI